MPGQHIYSIRRVAKDDPAIQTDVLDADGEPTGDTRLMTRSELLNRHALSPFIDPTTGEWMEDGAGNYVMDCGRILRFSDQDKPERIATWESTPGEIVAEGRCRPTGNEPPGCRFERAVREDSGLRDLIHTAVVYRARDETVHLRETIIADLGLARGVEARVPATGDTFRTPLEPQEAADVLEEAKRRATPPDPDTAAPVVRARVPMARVKDGDVVEKDLEPGHDFMT